MTGLLRALRHAIDFIAALHYLRIPIIALLFVTLIGAVGYTLLLDVSLLDGLYQSVITLSTVGFEELRTFDDVTKVFTIGLVFIGVGTVFYTITMAAATVVEGDLRRQFRRRVMMRHIDGMRDHVVVCGYGRVGEEIAGMLRERNRAFVVIDNSEEAMHRAEQDGCPVVLADAQDESALVKAGVERASALVAATTSDALNTYITLTARKLNGEICIIARSEKREAAEKLMLAGATRVISPYAIGARRMALSAMQPMMADFMDELATGRHGNLMIAELEVEEGSSIDGAALATAFANAPTTAVLAIRRSDQSLVLAPRGSDLLHAGDIVIAMAEQGDIPGLAPHRPKRD